MKKRKIEIYDTTLRDGSQAEGVSYTALDKLRIAQRLLDFGMDYVEGGFPGSNAKDQDFFKRARDLNRKDDQRIMAFGMTRRAGVSPSRDLGMKSMAASGADGFTLVGKTWDFHVTHALGVTLEENLAMVEESIHWLKSKGGFVIFDAEHFFDGYKNNPEYAIKVVEAAERGGADRIVLCDTNGGTLPPDVAEIVAEVHGCLDTPIGIHAHNDSDVATANSMAAIQSGATHVQGTINGLGERCGNANLCAILPNLAFKMNLKLGAQSHLKQITALSRFVADVTNRTVPKGMAYVGNSAFAHKGGMHVSAIRKSPHTYEHVAPESVGNKRRVLVSELSGKSNLESVLGEALGAHTSDLLEEIKRLEHLGYSFEAAEASLKLLMLRLQGKFQSPFTVEGFRTIGEFEPQKTKGPKSKAQNVSAEATVKVRVGKEVLHTAAEGDGPVNALDNALRKAICHFYPALASVRLEDYKVRVLDASTGTESSVRVQAESTDGVDRWSTVGVSTNVVEASFEALLDSFLYKLLLDAEKAGQGRPPAKAKSR